MIIQNKKGAIELSIGTIVIVVLAMSMLILGLVLIKDIFAGTKYNVDQLNKNVEAEINKLFNEKGGKIFIYLPKSEVEVKKGTSFGVAFAVKNTAQGESQAGKFTYEAKSSDVQKGCQLTLQQADSYLILGSKGSFDLLPGADPHQEIIKIQTPESAPLCEIKYNLAVTKDNQPYETSFFILKITG